MRRRDSNDTNVRVLLIESDMEHALQRKALLEGVGLHVIWSADGAEGLRLAHALVPDLIVINQHMPDIYGHQICQHLQENQETAEVPIILLTPNGDNSTLPNDLLAGLIHAVTVEDSPSAMLLETTRQIDLVRLAAGDGGPGRRDTR